MPATLVFPRSESTSAASHCIHVAVCPRPWKMATNTHTGLYGIMLPATSMLKVRYNVNGNDTAAESLYPPLSYVVTAHTYVAFQHTSRHGQRQEPRLSRSDRKRWERRPAPLLQHIPETRPRREVPPTKVHLGSPLPLFSSRRAKLCPAHPGLSSRRASARIPFRLRRHNRHHRGHRHHYRSDNTRVR